MPPTEGGAHGWVVRLRRQLPPVHLAGGGPLRTPGVPQHRQVARVCHSGGHRRVGPEEHVRARRGPVEGRTNRSLLSGKQGRLFTTAPVRQLLGQRNGDCGHSN
eukprot:1195292-Prorocentrum_minimum.AAC.1